MDTLIKIKRLSDDMDNLEHELDAFLDAFSLRGTDIFRLSSNKWRPPCDVLETKRGFVLRMEIAGVKPKDFNIIYHAGKLLINGRREHWPKEEDARYRQLELNSGYFERIIQLPKAVDTSGIKARYRDGMLEVNLPKTHGKDKQRTIIKIK